MVIKIAKKEIYDAILNKLLLWIILILLILTVVSIMLGSIQVRVAVDAYYHSVDFLKSMGKTELPSMPNLNPISISKGFANFIGMIGALLAIVLGHTAIAKEQKNGTLKLILSRGVFRDQLINGKLLGNMIFLAGITGIIALITVGALYLIAGVTITGDESLRLLFFFLMSFLYMAFFMILSMGMTIVSNKGNRGLLITVIIWLVLAFVLPQIGDTMDMDNQLPGGFFTQMGMNRDQEAQMLQKFKIYETVRDGFEEMSPTKHYERIAFALLNVKPGFELNNVWEVMGLKWVNLLGLLLPTGVVWMLTYLTFLRRENIF